METYVILRRGGVYQATSPEAIRRHAKLADLPVDEVVAVAATVLVHADPEPAAA